MRRIRNVADIGSVRSDLSTSSIQTPTVEVVSVDDHLIEPPDVFEGRFPGNLIDRAPYVLEEDDGTQVWIIDGEREPQVGLSAVAGRPNSEWTREPSRFNDMRPGCWRIEDRVRDMELVGVRSSVCFPSSVMGFSGTRQLRVSDRDVAWAMVQAYNDWYYESWWGPAPDRIILLQIPWLRDVEVAAQQIRANADRGFRAVTFCEDPARLGLPSIWTEHWDPFFQACEETETVLCLHVGSSGWHPTLATEAPPAMRPIHFAAISLITATEWLWSGVPTRFPNLQIVMSEGGVGWVPVLANRGDYVLHHAVGGPERSIWKDDLLPSEVLRRNFWFCTLDEPIGPDLVESIGVERILAETDYPHADSTWPHSQEVLLRRLGWMSEGDRESICHGNAERLFGLPRPEEVTV